MRWICEPVRNANPPPTRSELELFRRSMPAGRHSATPSSDCQGTSPQRTWAVPEAARLHAWVKSELAPLSESMESAVPVADVAARAAVASDRGLLLGLNSLLSGSRGQEAGQWAREIHTIGLALIGRLESLAA